MSPGPQKLSVCHSRPSVTLYAHCENTSMTGYSFDVPVE